MYQFEHKTKPKKASLHKPIVSYKRNKVCTKVEIIPNLLISLLDTYAFFFVITLIGEVTKVVMNLPLNVCIY